MMPSIKVDLKEWKVPNFAIVEGNDKTSIPVGGLPQEALDELARAWLDELYAKAGKLNTWRTD